MNTHSSPAAFVLSFAILAVLLGIYWLAFRTLRRCFKNIWVRWTVIWFLIFSLDYLSLYDTETWETNLTPFQDAMSLTGGIALLFIAPFLAARGLLVNCGVILWNLLPAAPPLSVDAFLRDELGWRSFYLILFEDLILCEVIFLLTQTATYFLSRRNVFRSRRAAPEVKSA